jgi:hypothetical protein
MGWLRPSAGRTVAPGPVQVVTSRVPERIPPVTVTFGTLDNAPDPRWPDELVFGPPPGERAAEHGSGRLFACCDVRGAGMTCWACGGTG